MSFEAVRAALAAHINTNWNTLANGVPLALDNLDAIDYDTQTEPYIEAVLKWRSAQQASIDGPTTRFDGEVVFYIHVPGGRGQKPATTLADAIAGFMQYRKVSNVQLLTSRLLPPQPAQGWQITPLAFSFFYRE